MPLHERDAVRQQLEDCVFAGRDLTRPVPKYRFPRDETQAREAFQVVSDELMLDGNARQNLATFCQTWAEPELLALMALSVNKNMIDKDEYPQTAEVERRCVHMLADLWHAPHAANTVGASAIGSSEACMLAGMAAKWRWRARRQAEGKPTDKPNMVCGPVQVVWHKFARYWDIEMREVPMSHGHYAMDPASMLERVDENTIMVVPTLGVTYTGAYEQVQAMSAALDQLQALLQNFRVGFLEMRPKVGHLVFAQRDNNFVDGRGSRKLTQCVNQNGHAVQLPELLAGRLLLGLCSRWRRHARA